ncbi:MAG: heat-inducible transcriptional repressor HrcA [Geminicoccaceae bacterium]|nr:heat-inducible transcriptional repressor HrcA [Geminicoccaceae bacterium]
MIVELNQRSREVFRQIVDAYMTTGEPVGSRTISRRLAPQLSPATIRNVMADLEEAGLLFAPHTSAGRLPTDAGLRLYVDGLLEVGALDEEDRGRIEARCGANGRSVESLLHDAVETLSGLSHTAGIVMAPTSERPFRHIEFVPLSPGRVLVVTVSDGGMVENRVIETPLGMSASTLIEAGNYLTTRLAGRTFGEMRTRITEEIQAQEGQLDALAKRVVEAGIATWAVGEGERDGGLLLVRGHANLLDDVSSVVDLERLRSLFTALETKRGFLRLIEQSQKGEGVQIFIGSENELFALSGCSLIIAPYSAGHAEGKGSSVVGAIGVIGPSRMNYARIIPMVDHTARVVSRLLGSPDNL